jgi:hypothetical protein
MSQHYLKFKERIEKEIENLRRLEEIIKREEENVPSEWKENYFNALDSFILRNVKKYSNSSIIENLVHQLTENVLMWCPNKSVINEQILHKLENLKGKYKKEIKDINCYICNNPALQEIIIEDWSEVGIYEGKVYTTFYYYPKKDSFYSIRVTMRLNEKGREKVMRIALKKLKDKSVKINDDFLFVGYENTANLIICQECGENENKENLIKERLDVSEYFKKFSEFIPDIKRYVEIKLEPEKYTFGNIFK